MPGITMQGTVPYPPTADAVQVLELARELGDVARTLGQTSTQVTATARTATSTWTGIAADAFSNRMADRSATIRQNATTLSRAVPILTTYATTITATQTAYTTAAVAEQAARAGLPWTAAALAAALAAESAAVATLQGAGLACGAGLGGIVAQLAAARFLTGNNGGSSTDTTADPGPTPASDDTWTDIATDIWDWIFGSDTNRTGTGTGTGTGGSPLGLPDGDGDGTPDVFDFDTWGGADTTAPLRPGDMDADGVPDSIDARDDRLTTGIDTTRMPTFPSGTTTDTRFDTYAAFFAERGVDVTTLADGERAILGLRDADSTTVNAGTGEYNDRIVVVWTEDGVRHVEEFVANTEPSAQYDAAFRGRTIDGVDYARGGSVQGADADGDGLRDLGRLPEGTYQYGRSTSTVVGGDNVLRGVRAVDLERDVNHDGVFDATDGQLVTRPGALTDQRSVLFHRGSERDTDSAACQTFPGRDDWSDFWTSLGSTTGPNRNPQEQFTYVLHEVDRANQPAPVPTRVPVP